MKTKMIGMLFGFFLLTSANAYAANGDLVVQGRLGVGSNIFASNSKLNISHTAVPIVLNESDQTGAIGYWRIPTANGSLRIDQNTATARDFSTYRAPFSIDIDGNVRLGGLAQASGGTETMFVGVNNGNVGIGTIETQGYKLYVNGPGYSTSNWISSDSKFKKNVEKIDNPLSKVRNLNGVSYEWKKEDYSEKGFPDGRHYGVIAQEIEKVLPEAVRDNADGTKAVAYNEIIPVLIEAIKEQQKEIDALKKKVAETK